MTTWEKLVTDEALNEVVKVRKPTAIQEKVMEGDISVKEADGWTVVKSYANRSALMEKPKPIGDAFEDEVWMIFQRMGFKVMNSDRKFKLEYSSGLTKQIDVVAIDDEVCLLIECKATAQEGNNHQWKTDLEAINGFREKLFAEIRTQYPNRKCKYIFATKNYVIGDQDTKRMADFQIANFDYETVQYYAQLVDHLGQAAKYQLLGNIFAKQTISSLDEKVPAIEGKMGGLTYYSFVIEPARLLKIAYILHRNKANHRMMPTYQRLIKKDRLKAIREYVNQGGYFPNSLIVSIDSNGRGVRFDAAQARNGDCPSRIGTLHLPKQYQSVYVIDGQHRLYGYSETQWADKNSVPVVAFVDLPKEDQVKMFMDINQNQKPVSKSLRNTLNIDLLWNSESYADRLEALMLNIGQELGEDPRSPLFGRIVTGEDTTSGKRCITLDYIKEALKQSRFFNTYKKKKNEVQTVGTFDKMDNDQTFETLFPFLTKSFQTVKDYCSEEWEKGQDGFLTINNCTYAILRIFDDIANIELAKTGKNKIDDPNAFYSECEPLLIDLCDTINHLDDETINVIKTSKGGSAKKDSWRKLQVAFHNMYPEFTNEELEKFIQENCVNNDDESDDLLSKILAAFKEKLWSSFPDKEKWIWDYAPESVRNALISKNAIENSKRENQGILEKADPWEFVSYQEILEIVKYGSNWSAFASSIFNVNGSSINKMEALSLIKNLESYKNKLSSAQHIVSSQYEEIKKIFENYAQPINASTTEE
ncbi:MAG: DGQHR domain-containing protein [Bacilli bacterium]|nr:DGQHR domain-containing protein [Bacilli bacterium]